MVVSLGLPHFASFLFSWFVRFGMIGFRLFASFGSLGMVPSGSFKLVRWNWFVWFGLFAWVGSIEVVCLIKFGCVRSFGLVGWFGLVDADLFVLVD